MTTKLQAQLEQENVGPDIGYSLMVGKLSRPEYDVNFLDGKVSKTLGGVSVLIPSHNRAPYDPKGLMGKYNPLSWCIESILGQKCVDIDKIVVVDDASDDYTSDLVKGLDNDKLLYLRNEKCLGSSISRNKGIKEIKSKRVQLTDDDCVSAPYSTFCGLATFDNLEKRGEKLGAVRLPVYDKSSFPKKLVKAKDIGRLVLKEGNKTENFLEYPEEYIFNEKFMDKERKILEPLETKLTNAYVIFDRDSYLKAGGFPDYFTWRNNCAEELEIALNMADRGKKIFFQPDRKAHAIHWRYGSGLSEFVGEDWKSKDKVTLNDMAMECKSKNLNTGNRVSETEDRHSHIISGMAIFRRDAEGLGKFIENTYRDFVHGKDPHNYKNSSLGNKTRKQIWKEAVKEGIEFIDKMGMHDVTKKVGDWNSIPNKFLGSN